MWKSKLPLKVKIFLWLLDRDRLQSAANLKLRGWKGNENCILCGVTEDSNHIFFTCILAKFVWFWIKGYMNWDNIPNSFAELQQSWLERGASSYQFSLFSFAAFVWTIWKTRNKMAIEKQFPKQPIAVIFKSISCLQRWSLLLKEKERQELDVMISRAEIWMKKCAPDQATSCA